MEGRYIGEQLKAARKLRSVPTAPALAKRINRSGFGSRVIGSIERNQRLAQDHEIGWLAEALDLPASYFEGAPAGEPSQLDRIERELRELRGQRDGFLRLLAEQTKLLELIGNLVGNDALAARADEAVKASIERTRGDLAKLLARASEQAAQGR